MSEISETELLSKQMSEMVCNDKYSDVIFEIDGEQIYAHRAILAGRCEYFRALLYNGMAETQQAKIELKVPRAAFRSILSYIYSGKMIIGQLDTQGISEILDLAHLYGIHALEIAIGDHLMGKLTLANILWTLETAIMYQMRKLIAYCYAYISINAQMVLEHSSFDILSESTLKTLLQKDALFAREIIIFRAVQRWYEKQPKANIKELMLCIRFPLIDMDDLLTRVRQCEYVEAEQILSAIALRHTDGDLPHRSLLKIEYNYGVSWANGTFDLKQLSLINSLIFRLSERSDRLFSYYVEVSADGINWKHLIDYQDYMCSSWQHLRFAPQTVRYVRFVTADLRKNLPIQVKSLQACFKMQKLKLHDSIVEPLYNVVRSSTGCTLVKHKDTVDDDSDNGGDFEGEYEGESECTCNVDFMHGLVSHVNSSGTLIFRLAQPYYISTARLFLANLPEPRYNVYMETSWNGLDWQPAVEKSSELVGTWLHFTFSPRIVMYIRVVGDKVPNRYRCTLECPSQDPVYMAEQERKLSQLEPDI